MSIGIWQILLILVIVFVIFGAGKLPRVMGDIGKGVRSMREGLKGEEAEDKSDPKRLSQQDTPGTRVEVEQDRDRQQ